jgi:hypothetical protein
VPRVEAVVELESTRHRYVYDAAGDRTVVREDGIRRCDHCTTADHNAVADEATARNATLTYCANCGSVACDDHLETEHLTGEPVCTGCAVAEAFPLTTKYFFDEDDRAAFRDRYAAMSPLEKLRVHLPSG